MTTVADLAGAVLGPLDRLAAALVDPSRRERTAVRLLIGYVAVWTLYGVLAKGSQDVHFDMGEAVAWSREPAFGYSKHPPLSAWVVRAWFTVFPLADWAYYLLAMVLAGLALWIAWILSARWLEGEKRAAGLALLTLVPFFNFHALKFNANTVLIPLWAATTLWFLRSFETRDLLSAAAPPISRLRSCSPRRLRGRVPPRSSIRCGRQRRIVASPRWHSGRRCCSQSWSAWRRKF